MSLALLILLPILLSGYVFALTWTGSRYFISREQGYRLYFRAAYYGCAIIVAAYYITLVIHSNINELLRPFDEAFGSFFIDKSSLVLYPLMQVAMVSLVIAHPMAKLLNILPYFFRNLRHHFIRVAIMGDDMEEFLWKATQDTIPIAVSMQNRKFYYGFLVSGYDPSREGDYIKILPLVSGFREECDLNLILDTFYDSVYEQIENAEQSGDESGQSNEINRSILLLPKSQIQSIGPFDIELYDEFQRRRSSIRNKFKPSFRAHIRN